MSDISIDAILASLAATYIAPSINGGKPRPTISLEKQVKVKAPKAPKAAKVEGKRNVDLSTVVLPKDLPAIGTYDAVSFFKALRTAGNRVSSNGQAVYDASLVREDTIRAIAGYCGFDPHGNFGAQDLAARSKAQNELRPIKGEEYRRVLVSSTVAGYVAGMPNETAKQLANLKGREALAIRSMIAHNKVANDASRSETDRKLSETLANVEKERVERIREDIALMIGQ